MYHQFLVWLKKFGPAKNNLVPVEGRGIRKHSSYFFYFRVHRSLFRWLYSGLDWELVCSLQYYCCDKPDWNNSVCLVWKWCTHCLKSVMILRLTTYLHCYKIYILQLYKKMKLMFGYTFLLEPT